MSAKCLFGGEGKPVGSTDGEWLFDEAGVVVGYIFESGIFSVPDGIRLGQYVGGAVFDVHNQPVALAAGAKPPLVRPLTSKLSPLVPRLMPSGQDVRGVKPDQQAVPRQLCRSLSELKAQS